MDARLEAFREQHEAMDKLRATLAVRTDDVDRHRTRMPKDAWDVLEHSGTVEKLHAYSESVRHRACAWAPLRRLL